MLISREQELELIQQAIDIGERYHRITPQEAAEYNQRMLFGVLNNGPVKTDIFTSTRKAHANRSSTTGKHRQYKSRTKMNTESLADLL